MCSVFILLPSDLINYFHLIEEIFESVNKQTKTAKKSSTNNNDNGSVIIDQKELNDRQILEESAVPIQTILDAVISQHPLSVLPESTLSLAIEEFVEKKSLTAIADFIEESIKKSLKAVKEEKIVKEAGTRINRDEIDRLLRKHQQLQQEQENKGKIKTKIEGEYQKEILEGLDMEAIDRMTKKGKSTKSSSASRGRGKKSNSMEIDDNENYSDNGDEEDEEEDYREEKKSSKKKPAATSRTAKPKPAKTNSRPSRATKLELESEENENGEMSDSIENSTPKSRRRSINNNNESPVNNNPPITTPPQSSSNKRGRVKEEISAVPLGARGKRGELNFLSSSSGSARGKSSSSLPSARATRQRQIVDLIED